jgi:uncharacterized membrane protein YkoI
MNKKLMVGALAVALVSGGIAGAALLPSTNAAAPVVGTPVQNDQVQQDIDKEVNDDAQQGKQDNDKEVNDDAQQGEQNNDKEVNDDAADVVLTPTINKQQSIDIAVKQTPGVVTDVKLEAEDGKAAYSITIKDSAGTEHEITVDATTGTISPEND